MSNFYYYEAEYGKRIGAYLIDSIIILLPTLIFCICFSSNQNVFLIGFVLLQILCRLYFLLMNRFYNGTIGKKTLKIKIINYHSEEINEKIPWKNVILRQILDIICNIPQIVIPVISVLLINNWQGYQTFSYALKYYKSSPMGKFFMFLSVIITIVEIITMLKNEENRSLHDLIAKTIVVEE